MGTSPARSTTVPGSGGTDADQGRRAVPGDRAGRAVRLARVAGPPPVEDQPVAEQGPLGARDQRRDVLLDLDRVLLGGPAEPAGEPAHVGVHRDAGDAERVAEHDVRRLAADAGQRHQVLQPGRHLAVEPLDQRPSEALQRAGLGAEEPGGSDEVLELGRVGARVARGVRVAGEQRRRDLVDPHVGGLRGQHRRHQQLERGAEVELAPRVRPPHGERAVDPARAADQGDRRPGRGRRRLGGPGGTHAARVDPPGGQRLLWASDRDLIT